MDRIVNSSLVSGVMWRRTNADNIANCNYKVNVALPPQMHVVITGEGKELGDWQPATGVKLLCEKIPTWYVPSTLNIEDGTLFKFVIMEGDTIIKWEEGENRVWDGSKSDLGSFCSQPSFNIRLAGVAIPVFSIRAKGCEGIGDFTSLGEFGLWASNLGMRVVQTLPVNDTTITHTYLDSYPYNAISIYALHPMYIRVSEIDAKADVSELLALENSDTVDYEQVDKLKWEHFRKIYAKKGKRTLSTKGFEEFFKANKEWLKSYAVYSFLRDKFQTANFNEWAKPYNKYSKRLENKVIKENERGVGLYYFLQYHADKQLRKARQTARKVGVVFKGDIPIGVSPQSVEVWKEPHLFNLDAQTGAPPDDFAVDGQNWGFPTYNWREMASDNFQWWKNRFEKMADYFDMYRIDHILGFFRIWEIPSDIKSGVMGQFSPSLPLSAQELKEWGLPMYEDRYMGEDKYDQNTLFVRDHSYPELYHPRITAQFTARYCNVLDDYEKEHFNSIYTHYFYHRHNDFWAGKALNKLPALLNSTSMLPCAEDLGMIPDCVGWVLDELQVATLEIQRMPKEPYQLFGNPSNYPYRSVATTSTHDTSTIRGWWQEDRLNTQQYYNDTMGWVGEAPAVASGEICRAIVESHLLSDSFAVILPWQDYMAIDEALRLEDAGAERINEPAHAGHYWHYRMHLSVDRLVRESGLSSSIREMVEQSQR
ncbi:MAG: 4-alpha-glucanotransferase [Rikenellaceae bacterium]